MPSRVLALALALLAMAVPVLSGLHGVEGHRYCAVHQTLEEAPTAGAARVEPSATQIATAADAAASEHTACPFAAVTAGTLVTDTAPDAVVAPSTQAPPSLRCALPPLVTAVLDLAPKTSPPALAV